MLVQVAALLCVYLAGRDATYAPASGAPQSQQLAAFCRDLAQAAEVFSSAGCHRAAFALATLVSSVQPSERLASGVGRSDGIVLESHDGVAAAARAAALPVEKLQLLL